MIERSDIVALSQLVSLTKGDFRRIYLKTIANLSRLFLSGEPLNLAIKNAVRALKIRRAYMLPKGSDAETCYQEQEVWTYAVFVASIWCDCERVLKRVDYGAWRAMIAPEVSGWLQRYPRVLKALAWEGELADSTLSPVLLDIVGRAQGWYQQVVVYQAPKPAASPTIVLPDGRELATAVATEEHEAPLALPVMSLGERFLSWVQHGFATEALTINEPESLVHRVKAGVFLRMPECGMAFNSKPELYATLLKELMQTRTVIKNGTQLLHAYTVGPWRLRNTADGVVLQITAWPELTETPMSQYLQAECNLY